MNNYSILAALAATTIIGSSIVPSSVFAQTADTSISSATTVSSDDAANEEILAWEAAQQSNNPEDIFAFIEAYPDGAYIKEAKLRIIDLLWVDLEENSPTPATLTEEPVEEVVPEEPEVITALPTGNIELRSDDGFVAVEGVIIAFDDALITIKTSYGTVGIENDGIACIGATCPTALLAEQ